MPEKVSLQNIDVSVEINEGWLEFFGHSGFQVNIRLSTVSSLWVVDEHPWWDLFGWFSRSTMRIRTTSGEVFTLTGSLGAIEWLWDFVQEHR